MTYTFNNVTYSGKQLSFKINDLLGNPLPVAQDIFFRVDVYNYDAFSYQFRNPRIVVPAASAGFPLKRIYVRNIKIMINDVVKPEHPIWTPVELTSNNVQTTILSTSAMLATKDQGNAIDKIAFNFQEIKIDSRTAAELSRDFFEKTLYKITRANCAGCHTNSNNPQVPNHTSLNIQTAHDAAVLLIADFNNPAGSQIVSRIRNGHKMVDPVDVPLMMEQAIIEWRAGRP